MPTISTAADAHPISASPAVHVCSVFEGPATRTRDLRRRRCGRGPGRAGPSARCGGRRAEDAVAEAVVVRELAARRGEDEVEVVRLLARSWRLKPNPVRRLSRTVVGPAIWGGSPCAHRSARSRPADHPRWVLSCECGGHRSQPGDDQPAERRLRSHPRGRQHHRQGPRRQSRHGHQSRQAADPTPGVPSVSPGVVPSASPAGSS
jgi:hypothetical protein